VFRLARWPSPGRTNWRRWPSYVGALVVVCAVLPLAALAGSQSYWSDSGNAGTGGYAGYNNIYQYNQVWHQAGNTFDVYYVMGDGYTLTGDVRNNTNPTKWPYSVSYADPWCENINDWSGVTWTCQYGY
jgi:hypothetical protein